jgi:hypothetical protein
LIADGSPAMDEQAQQAKAKLIRHTFKNGIVFSAVLF